MPAIGSTSFSNRYGKKPQTGPRYFGDLPTMNRYGQSYNGGAPPAPAAPAAPQVTQPAAPAAAPRAPADPKDSSYQAQLAQLLAQRNNQLTDYGTARTRANEDVYGLRGSIASLAENRGKALEANKVNASKGGIFYSGILGKDLADTNKGYDDQQANIVQALTRQLADIATGEQRAREGYDTGAGSAYADAVQRALQTDAALAQQQALTAPVQSAAGPQAAAGGQPRVVSGTDSKGNRGEWHIYPDGRKVFVRK